MFNNKSKFHLVAIGVAAKDKVEDEVYIDVYPAELQPVKDGEISDTDEKNDTIVDNDGNFEVVVNKKTTLIKAKWIPTGEPNRLGAPDVRKGEKVFLYQYADLDEYYWMMFDNDLRLRKNEKHTLVLSNRPKIATDDADLEKAYYITFDTINKLFRLHTDDSDGELTTYDIDINTKEGIFTILDGNDNMIELKSENGELTINTNLNVTINTPHAYVNCETSDVKCKKTATIDAGTSITATAGSEITAKAPLITIKGDKTDINP